MILRDLMVRTGLRATESMERLTKILRLKRSGARQLELVSMEDRLLFSAAPMPAPEALADAAQIEMVIAASLDASVEILSSAQPEQNELSAQVQGLQPLGLDGDGILAVTSRELVFIDTGVENYQELLDDLWSHQDPARQIDVVLLSASEDGVTQITETLAQYTTEKLDAVHFVTHGADRAIKLGNTWLDAATLDENRDQIARWGEALQPGADLLVYGCDLAGNDLGRALLNNLVVLTGADIAASIDDTGSSQLGGDWDLEYEQGEVETDIAFSALTQEEYDGLLDSFSVTSTADSGVGSLRQAILDANALGGADTIQFNILGDAIHTITLASELPQILEQVSIDATTETDFAGTPRVVLTGSGLYANGFYIQGGSGSSIRGFTIQGFTTAGINIISSNNNTIVGNYIGTSASGNSAAGNYDGINIFQSSGNIIGGLTSLDRNVISGNTNNGVVITGNTSANNIIQGNYIGVGADGTSDLGNRWVGLYVDSPSNTIGGTAVGAGNVISGTGISGTGSYGIYLQDEATGTVVQGNIIGLNAAGTGVVTNYGAGLVVTSSGNLIGGSTPSARNIISGNTANGILITGVGATGNTVSGNYIGTNLTGLVDLGNGEDGVQLEVGASSNTIGGLTAAERNVISGNNNAGIAVDGATTASNVLIGNYVGLGSDGTTDLGNTHDGIHLQAATSTVIGGTTAGSRNVISGNEINGIGLDSATGTIIQGNSIGTDATGLLDRGNTTDGISLVGTTINTQVGGIGGGNIISGNNAAGIYLDGASVSGATIQANYIGTDLTGTGSLGNSNAGVDFNNSAHDNLVGGQTAGTGNTIAFNAWDGVRVRNNAVGIAILGNSIYSNTETGIDLQLGGVTANDPTANMDSDTGSNNLQNFPVLTRAVTNQSNRFAVDGTFNSLANTNFRIELYSSPTGDVPNGEGRTYLGFINTRTDSSGNSEWGAVFNVNVASGSIISATATRLNSALAPVETSEFAANVTISTTVRNVINTNDSGAGSLRQAIIDANATTGMDIIQFSITGAGPHTITLSSELPTITDSIVIDGTTEPDYTSTPVIELNGNNAGTLRRGLILGPGSGGSMIRGLTINRFTGTAIEISGSSHHTIQGNWIGLNATGTAASANGVNGIYVTNSIGNLIGGTTAAERNVVSGNSQQGIYLNNADYNTISGNYIGTNESGTGDVTGTGSNTQHTGVYLGNGSSNNTIGGTATGAGNVISGNNHFGLEILGTTSQNNQVQGNLIGTTANGLLALGNTNGGISFWGAGAGNTLGGTASGARNVVSGNLSVGVLVGSGSTGAVITANYIGVGTDGTTALGNSGDGVRVEVGSTTTLIGGQAAGAGNVIANNTGNGVNVSSSFDTAIVRNSIHSNTSLGINLGTAGVTANGSGVQNYSVLSSAVTDGTQITITGSLNSAPWTSYRIEFYSNITGDGLGYGEGQTLIGIADVTTDGFGVASISAVLTAAVPAGRVISATASRLDGGDNEIDTSEFSQNVIATAPATPGITVTPTTGLTTTEVGGTASFTLVLNTAPTANVTIQVGSSDTTEGTLSGPTLVGNTLTFTSANWDTPQTITVTGTNDALVDGDITYAISTLTSSSTDLNYNGINPADVSVTNTDDDLYSISGTIYEDVDGDGLVSDDGVGLANAIVSIYRDNGDGTMGAGDTIVDSQLANASGQYTFSGLAMGNYWVVADSRSFIGAGGLNASYSIHDQWAEQTYGAAGSVTFDGSSYSYSAANGTMFGGMRQDRSDNGASLLTGEHVTRVSVASANVTGIDYGFSYNAVTNTRDGDDVGANNRSVQGSLRQFIQNSNALVTTQSSNFEITAPLFGGAHTIDVSGSLPSMTDAVILDATTETDFAGTPILVLNGATAGLGVGGLEFLSGAEGSTARGFVIQNFDSTAIWVNGSDNITIAGNFIGTDVTGTIAAGNSNGIMVEFSSNVTIGGLSLADRNIISGSRVYHGVWLDNTSSNNTIVGNYIGTDVTGQIDLGNANDGVRIENGSTNNTIGGTTPAARNVISGNEGSGVAVQEAGTSGNVVQGNYIGTDVDGEQDLGNTANGVNITASGNTIGGSAVGAGNVISGNTLRGVYVTGAGVSATIQGNYVGTDKDGLQALGNSFDGIEVNFGAGAASIRDNLVAANGQWGINLAGTGAGNTVTNSILGLNVTQSAVLGGAGIGASSDGHTITGNTVGGSTTYGIYLTGSANNTIQGNFIGTNSTGATGLGNALQGISIDGANSDNNLIGGTDTGEGNVIAHNTQDGIAIASGAGTGITMLGNTIYGNGGLAIDLNDNGVTGNDPNDSDPGANGLQNYPVITAASLSGTDLTISGSLDTDGLTSQYRIEFYGNPAGTADMTNGEGRVYLGSTSVTTDASGDATFTGVTLSGVSLTVGDSVTATATRIDTPAQVGVSDFLAYGSTSELAANQLITAANNAPSLVAASMLNSINEDDTTNSGTLVSLMVDTEATDIDTGAVKGIAIISVPTTNGTWEYTQDGATWLSVGTPTTTAALLLPADATTAIRFVPNAEFNGNSGLLFYKAWDQTSGAAGGTADVTFSGASTAFSAGANGTSVSVSSVNDQPVITSLDGSPTYIEGGAGVVLDSNVSIFDAELSALNDFNGGTLTLTRSGGAHPEDQLAFDGLTVTVSGADLFVSGVQVGTYLFSGGAMSITFGTGATNTQVNTVMQNIVYWNSSDNPPASVQLNWTFGDGNGGVQGTGGVLSAVGSTMVTITPTNDSPDLRNGGIPDIDAVEGTTFSLPASAGFQDADGEPLSYSISGLPVGLTYDSGTGLISGTIPIGASTAGPYTITVTATDGGTESVVDSFTLQGHTVPTLVHTGAWTTTNSGGSATAGPIDISVDMTVNPGGSVAVPFVETLSPIPVYSDDARQGAESLRLNFGWDESPELGGEPAAADAVSGQLTISFSQAVTNPILHLERLGGFGDWTWNSMRMTLQTPGVTLQELSGTASFEVDEAAGFIQRASNTQSNTDGTAISESAIDWNVGTAAGSVRLIGTFTSLSFLLEAAPGSVEGAGGDGFEIAFSLNEIPTAVGNSYATGENSPVSGNVLSDNTGTGVDSDPEADSLTVQAINGDTGDIGNAIVLPSGATLTLNSDGSYSYDPRTAFDNLAAGQMTVDSFTYTVTDANGGSDTATVSLTINGVNDAPSLNGGTNLSLTSTDEEMPSSPVTVASLLASGSLGFADVDSGAEQGIAITTGTGAGNWQYSTNGLTWVDVVGVSTTNALLLDDSTQLRFNPDGQNGGLATIVFRAWDRTTGTASTNAVPSFANPGTGGLATAFSSSSANLLLTVTSVNDAPIVGGGFLSAVLEDATNPSGATINSLIASSFFDVDAGASFSGIAVTSNNALAAEGVWQYSTDSGSNWFDVGPVGVNGLTLDSSTRVRFLPTGDFNGSPTLLSLRGLDNSYSGGFTSGATRVTVATSSPGGTSPISSSLVSIGTTITAVNDTPVLTAGSVNNLTVLEDSGLTSLGLGSLVFGPGGSSDEASQTLTYQVTTIPHPTFFGVVYLADGTTPVSVGTYSLAEIQGMQFRPATDRNGGPSFFGFQVVDTGGASNGGADTSAYFIQLNITAANDAPVVSLPGGTQTYTEGDSPLLLDSTATVSDIDSANFDGGTLTASIPSNASIDDRIGIHNQGVAAGQIGLSANDVTFGGTPIGTFTGGTNGATPLVVTFNSNATVAAVQELARNITFSHVSANPSTATRQVQIVLTDGDGGTSNNGLNLINVVRVNDAPAVTLSSLPINYTENGAVGIDTVLSVSDVDSTTLTGATIQITGNYISSEDQLNYSNMLGISGSWSGGTGTLTLTGAATVADYQTALRSIAYFNLSDAPNTAQRTFSLSVTDGTASSVTTTRNINVNSVNDAPTITTNALSISEGGTVVLGSANIATNDPDNTVAQLTYSVTSISGGQFELVATTGVAISSFTQAQINAGQVQFVHDESEAAPNYALTVFDGSLADGPEVVSLGTFMLVNDAPSITTNTLSILEGGTVVLSPAEIASTDPDHAPAQLTYTVSSLSGGRFELVAATGVPITAFTQDQINASQVQFAHNGGEVAPAYALTVSDGTLSDGPHDMTLGAFTNVNDAPAIIAPATVTITSTQDSPFVGLNAISISDTDATSLVMTISVSNGGFSLSRTTGLTFTTGDGTSDAVVEFSGSIVDINAALNGARYQYGLGHGSAESLTIQASDQGQLGLGGEMATISTTTLSIPVPTAVVGDAFLQGNYLEIGLGQDGAIGSDGAAPIGFNSAGSLLGAQVDNERDGWASYDGDFIMPGSPEEAWGVQVGGVAYSNSSSSVSEITGNLINYQNTSTGTQVEWLGAQSGLQIHQTYVVGADNLYLDVEVQLTNLSGVDLTDVFYYRNIDPDNNVDQGSLEGFTTTNTIVSQGNGNGVSLVTATQADGSYLGLMGFGENSRVTYGGFLNRTPEDIYQGTGGLSQSGTSQNDEAVSLAYRYAQIADGESVSMRFRYYFSSTDAVVPVVDLDADNSRGVSGGDVSATFTEGAGPVVIVDSDATVLSPSGAPLTSLTVTISNHLDGVAEQLSADTSGTGLVASYDSGLGVLKISGVGSDADYRTVLRTLTYDNSSLNPSLATREITVIATTGAHDSLPVTAFVNVIAVNNGPAIDANQLTIGEGQSIILTSGDLHSADPDSTAGQLTYSVSAATNGRFERTALPGVAISTFTQAEVDGGTIRFVHDGSDFAPNYNVTVSDGSQIDGPQAATITFSYVNDVPSVSVIGSQTIAEDTTLGPLAFTVGDSETAAAALVVTASSSDGVLIPNGNIVLGGSGNTRTITLTPALNQYGGPVTITLSVSDGTAMTVTTFDVVITPVNDTPTTSPAAFTLSENAANGSVVVTVLAGDVDLGDTRAYAILSGNTAGAFAIDAAGVITVANSTALDFETTPVWGLTVEVRDAGGLTATSSVTVTLSDTNDNHPVITSHGMANAVALTILENSTAVTTVTTTDPDTAPTISFTLAGDDAGLFAVHPTTGELRFINAPDHETSLDLNADNIYEVTVLASDGVYSATQSFSVSVSDLNEAGVSALTDTDGAIDRVAEDATIGALVGIIAQATDADGNDSVSYSLLDDAGGRFAIHATTGQVTVNAALNYEASTTHSIRVQARSTDGSTSVRDWTIAVTDVNESAISPVSDLDPTTDSVTENALPGTAVGVVAFAADLDGTDVVSYSLAADAGGRLAIDPVSGRVTVAGTIDFEVTSTLAFTVLASSSDGSTSSRDFVLSVNDQNDNAPVVNPNQVWSLPENSPAGTVVGRVSGLDIDTVGSLQNWTITGGTGAGAFAIDPATGDVRVVNSTSLDREATPILTLLVTVSDGVATSSVETVTIQLTNVNEAPEINGPPSVVVNEDSTTGTLPVVLFDTDTAVDSLVVTATSSNSTIIPDSQIVISGTGANRTVTITPVADQNGGPVTITLTVTDGEHSTQTSFEVVVTAVNDAPSIAGIPDQFINEDSTSGPIALTVGDIDSAVNQLTVTATSSDQSLIPDSNLLVTGTGANRSMTVRPAANQHGGPVTITVVVSDGQLTTQRTFTVEVAPVNDLPVIAPLGFVVSENSLNGTVVGTVIATDVDAGAVLQYSVDGGNLDGAFAIDPNTGRLTVANSAALDFEANSVYQLIISVTDGVSPPQSTTITIRLTDVNEGPTSLGLAGNVVTENSIRGTVVGQLQSTDGDAGDVLTYSLVDDAGGLFVVDPSTGAITVNGLLNYEANSEHTIIARVTDRGRLTLDRSFRITVIDQNEAPVLVGAAFQAPENGDTGVVVGVVAASDVDAGDQRTFSLEAGNAGGAFAIDPTTGTITVANRDALDFETQSTYTLTAQVTDRDGLSHQQGVTISLIDLNERPTIVARTYRVDEWSAVGTAVGTVTAFDEDGGDGLQFRFVSGNTGGRFAIDPATGQITVADETQFTYESQSSFSLTVQIEDRSGLTHSAEMVVIVDNVNTPPIVENDHYTIAQFKTLTVSAAQGILANDSDSDSAILNWTIIQGPQHGVLTIQADGSLTYSPDSMFFGVEEFTYVLDDGRETSRVATVSIEVSMIGPGGGTGDGDNDTEDDGSDEDSTDDSENTEDDNDQEDDENSGTDGGSPGPSQLTASQPGNASRPPEGAEGIPENRDLQSQTNDLSELVNSLVEPPTAGVIGDRSTDRDRFLPLRTLLWETTVAPAVTEPVSDLTRTVLNNPTLWNGLNRFRESLDEQRESNLRMDNIVVGTTTAVTGSLTVGYVIWLIRGGSLLATMMSVMPTWMSFDPLPVMDRFEEEELEDDRESLSSIVSGHPSTT